MVANVTKRSRINPVLSAQDALDEAVAQVETELGEDGRVLVRPSGTEPLVRVMVEATEETNAIAFAEKLANIIKNL